MEPLEYKPTEKTPLISFNNYTGNFVISGRSIPEDSVGFYKPLFRWIEEYMKSPNDKTELTVNLEYFNTSSSKCLSDVFRLLEVMHIAGSDVLVKWVYEEDNEDILEIGESYSSSTKVPFKLEQL